MAELTEHTLFPFSAHPLSATLESDQPSGTLIGAAQPAPASSVDASPAIDLTRRTLRAWTRACLAGRLASIRDQVAEDFRLGSGDLQSRSRKQRLAFARQLAMYLGRKITGAPFEMIGAQFNRDYSTAIHACQLIERRIQRDAAFRLSIKELEGRITETVRTTVMA